LTCTLYANYIVAKAETPYCGLSAPQLIIIESNLQRLFYTPIKEVLIYERHCEIVTIVPADNGGEPL
jgi:hypothetical protein